MGFVGGPDGKEPACNAGDPGSIPRSVRSPGEGNGCLLHYSFFFLIVFFLIFIFKLYIIVLVLPNIKMNLPQVYMCSPS